MPTKALALAACALPAALMSGAAAAASYNGNWPITITHAQFYDGTYCLTLNGALNGGAALSGPLGNLNGNFQVFGHTLVAIVPLQNGGGFNDGEEFILPARKGNLSNGTYLEDGDGEMDNSGVAQVGTKNGC